ncbi:MAG: Formate hydrogenlyase subunit 7 [Spirochaetes bacterium ADurb.Bin218]|jgi:Ni,Fe-hydrogenase III small subunit|nr:MAG: Formate hydrogenlyase subunit 7 [Spirochaetes bacterium ADurb.Bin218]HOQ13256.1 NADH:ubiquinone oxidoreductase [Spirochaetota bacterium]
MIKTLSVLFHNGRQFIPDVINASLKPPFRGRPIITNVKIDEKKAVELCPVGAISRNPFSIDLGKCVFCGECSIEFPEKIIFTQDYKLATNIRERLIIKEGEDIPITIDKSQIRPDIKKICKKSLKLREISAAGDNSAEWEMNASNNVQFDISRYGIEFVASPRHADGILITGPISQNMAKAVEICYDATPEPQIIILAGTDAISGGIFNGSRAICRDFIKNNHVDLYIPGNPPHPLTIINGLLNLID